MEASKPQQLVTLATCSLDQWSLDFDGNKARIAESCRVAKERGARYRLGPELEISGYGCEDHFLEADTLHHSLLVLRDLLESDLTQDLVCDFGLPLMHNNGTRFNVRAICLNREILCFRPKQALADDGNYRESRWFARWTRPCAFDLHLVDPLLRPFVGDPRGLVPFGDVCVRFSDGASVGVESCEELFTPDAPNIRYGLAGVDILGNGSGSHQQLRKLHTRVDLIQNATRKSGGTYLYANQSGCDGGRLGYDGCALVASGGDVLAQGLQFFVADVEVVCATVDLEQTRAQRAFAVSRGVQSATESRAPVPFVYVDDWALVSPHPPPPKQPPLRPSRPISVQYHSFQEEIALGPAVWLWDYLRRSGASGFFLPLSGGADSASVAAIVYSMCTLVAKEAARGNATVLQDCARILGESSSNSNDFTDPHRLANRILHTSYLGTQNSSRETRALANDLAGEIGNFHLDLDVQIIVNALVNALEKALRLSETMGKSLAFSVHGGSKTENLALQNVQARVRMVFSYALAQLLVWTRSRGKRHGFLLVLGTSNVDEALRGYYTKYDCSSADVNPIGSISKLDLRQFMEWGASHLGLPTLGRIVARKSTAELEPITETHRQASEDDMGCTFEELSLFGRLRKMHFMGPLFMYRRLAGVEWSHLPNKEVADKVKFLFTAYSTNRHKITTLPPALHCESYSPDDNRFDLRPFLYRNDWSMQFRLIDQEVVAATRNRQGNATIPPPPRLQPPPRPSHRPVIQTPQHMQTRRELHYSSTAACRRHVLFSLARLLK